MYEQQLWRSILGIFGTLLLTNLAEIPNVQPAIGARRSQYCLVVRRPLHLEYLILMRLETVQFQLQVAQIPQSDCFISAARRQNKFGVWIEAETVDFGSVGIHSMRRFACVVASGVPDHELLVIGH